MGVQIAPYIHASTVGAVRNWRPRHVVSKFVIPDHRVQSPDERHRHPNGIFGQPQAQASVVNCREQTGTRRCCGVRVGALVTRSCGRFKLSWHQDFGREPPHPHLHQLHHHQPPLQPSSPGRFARCLMSRKAHFGKEREKNPWHPVNPVCNYSVKCTWEHVMLDSW